MSQLLHRLEVEERLRRLPERCRMLAGGLDNSDNDPELVFAGLPFADVMALAHRDQWVYLAFQGLRPEQFERLFGADHGVPTMTRLTIAATAVRHAPSARLGGVQL